MAVADNISTFLLFVVPLPTNLPGYVEEKFSPW